MFFFKNHLSLSIYFDTVKKKGFFLSSKSANPHYGYEKVVLYKALP